MGPLTASVCTSLYKNQESRPRVPLGTFCCFVQQKAFSLQSSSSWRGQGLSFSNRTHLQISSPTVTPSAARFLFRLPEVRTSPLDPLSHCSSEGEKRSGRQKFTYHGSAEVVIPLVVWLASRALIGGVEGGVEDIQIEDWESSPDKDHMTHKHMTKHMT